MGGDDGDDCGELDVDFSLEWIVMDSSEVDGVGSGYTYV